MATPKPDPNVEALVAYLRQHSARFNLEALELQMHAAGHTPETVRKALARFLEGAQSRSAPAPTPASTPATTPAGTPAGTPAPPAAGDAAPPPPASAGWRLPNSLLPQQKGSTAPQPARPVVPPPPGSPEAAAPGDSTSSGGAVVRRPAWGAALSVAAFDLVLAGAGYGLVKAGEGKSAWLGGCVLVLVPLALLLELLVGLVLTASDGTSRAGRALLYGSLMVLGVAALALAGVGIFLASRSK